MNFVALIGLIININRNKNYIEIKIDSNFQENYIVKVYVIDNESFNIVKVGTIVGINGKIDFLNNNEIIAKNLTII